MCCGSSPASRRPMAVSARRLMVRARDRRNPAGQISVALGRIGMGDRRLSLCGIDPACAGRGVGASVAAGIRRLERHQDQRKRRGGRRPALIHEWRTTESSPFSSGRCSAFFDRLVRRRPAVAVTGTCLVRSRGLRKDGKEHRYWSIVESRHCAGGRVAQRPVLHLGVMNDSQREAWCHQIDAFAEASGRHRAAAAEFAQGYQLAAYFADAGVLSADRLRQRMAPASLSMPPTRFVERIDLVTPRCALPIGRCTTRPPAQRRPRNPAAPSPTRRPGAIRFTCCDGRP
jgi:hypothetical protein